MMTNGANKQANDKERHHGVCLRDAVIKSRMFLEKPEDVSRWMFYFDNMLTSPSHSEFSKPVLNPLTATTITKIFFRQPYSSFQKGEQFK